MSAELKRLPLEDRFRLVEDLWDSIADEAGALPLTPAPREELDDRLAAWEADENPGRRASDAVAEIRRRL